MDTIASISRVRGARAMNPQELPDLVTFADVNEPKTVMEINPNDLQATLGPNISWNEITLEVTDEPIAKSSLALKMPWMPAYRDKMLDGATLRDKNTLANTLSTADFQQNEK